MTNIPKIGILCAIACLALLIGCAGGSGGEGTSDGSTNGTAKALSIQTYDPADRVAVRDGEGPWVELTRGSAGFQTNLSASSVRYSVVTLAPSRSNQISFYHLTTDDTLALDLRQTFPATGILNGTVNNVSAGQTVYTGNVQGTVSGSTATILTRFVPGDFLVYVANDQWSNNLRDPLTPAKGSMFRGASADFGFASSTSSFVDMEARTIPVDEGTARPTRFNHISFQPAVGSSTKLPISLDGTNMNFRIPPTSQWLAGDHLKISLDNGSGLQGSYAVFDPNNIGTLAYAMPVSVQIQLTEHGRRAEFTTDPGFTYYRLHVGANLIEAMISPAYLQSAGMGGVYEFNGVPLPGFDDLTQRGDFGGAMTFEAYVTDVPTVVAMSRLQAASSSFDTTATAGTVAYFLRSSATATLSD